MPCRCGADVVQAPFRRRAGAGTAYCQSTESFRLPSAGSTAMADKSPRQHLAKKAGKSIKEKRAEKHAKADAKTHLDVGQIGKK